MTRLLLLGTESTWGRLWLRCAGGWRYQGSSRQLPAVRSRAGCRGEQQRGADLAGAGILRFPIQLVQEVGDDGHCGKRAVERGRMAAGSIGCPGKTESIGRLPTVVRSMLSRRSATATMSSTSLRESRQLRTTSSQCMAIDHLRTPSLQQAQSNRCRAHQQPPGTLSPSRLSPADPRAPRRPLCDQRDVCRRPGAAPSNRTMRAPWGPALYCLPLTPH